MKAKAYSAHATITIDASRQQVWKALTKPEWIKKYFQGEILFSKLEAGAEITFRFQQDDSVWERRGIILHIRLERILKYEMFPSEEDNEKIIHIVKIELSKKGQQIQLSFGQGNHPTEADKQYCEESYIMLLNRIKNCVENKN